MILDQPQVLALREIGRRFPKGSTILDVGCGKPNFISALAEAGYKALGTETSEEMVDMAKEKGLQVYLTDDPREITEKVDCTTCFEVIEHVPDPLDLLHRLPKGPLYLSTPNSRRWWIELTGHIEPWDYPPNHVRRFDAATLDETLSEAGYSEIAVKPTKVVYLEILQPLYISLAFKIGVKKNTTDYESVRNRSSAISYSFEGLRRLSWPITQIVAAQLNRKGYAGTSLFAAGQK